MEKRVEYVLSEEEYNTVVGNVETVYNRLTELYMDKLHENKDENCIKELRIALHRMQNVIETIQLKK